jgi:hypothetical protein
MTLRSLAAVSLTLAGLFAFAVPIQAQEGKDKPAADTKPAAKGKVDFQTQVLPIFEKNCVECHATATTGADGKLKKPKGGVTLDSKDGITTSKKGKLIVAKKPDDSLLWQSITLPADDEDRMPPPKKGDPLSQEQQELIKKWIDEGAEFGSWTGKKAEPPKDKPAEKDKGGDKPAPKDPSPGSTKGQALVALQKGLQALPAATLAPFANGPFQVMSLGDGSPLLQVSCHGQTDRVDDGAVATLAPLAGHIAELDLGRSRVGDAGCQVIATMSKLVALDLRQTPITNQGAALLVANKELRSLNLFGTKVGDYALAAFAELKHLEQLYLWQTETSASAIVKLRETLPALRVVIAMDLPEPMAEAPAGRRRPR